MVPRLILIQYFICKRPLQIVEKKPILRDFMKKQFYKHF